MRHSRRVNTAHGALFAIEFAAVPVAILVTFVLMIVTALLVTIVSGVGSFVGLGESAVGFASNLVVFVAALLLASTGAIVVLWYRQYVRRKFVYKRPWPLFAVPAAGLFVPFGYSYVELGTLNLTWWLFVIVAVQAYALAFRTITVDSLLRDRREEAMLVGMLTAIPAVVGLLTLVSEQFLEGSADAWPGTAPTEVASALLTIVNTVGLPSERWLIVLTPLLVVFAYAVRTYRPEGGSFDVTESVPQVGGALGSVAETVKRRFAWERPSTTDAGTRFGRSQASRGSSHSSGGKSVVPSSAPKSDTSNSRSSGSRSSGSGTRSRSPGSGSSGSGSSTFGSPSGGSSTGSSSGRSSSTGSSSDSASPSSDSGSRSSDSGSSGSDTRIFTDDFGATSSTQTPVNTCPACEKDIPSDGVYTFCPFCGHQL